MLSTSERKDSNISNRPGNKGQSLLEFALVLPLLFLVVFGVLDLGRVYFSIITLTSAAREGARYLTFHANDISNTYGAFQDTKQAVIREAQYSGIDVNSADVVVNCTNVDDQPSQCDGGEPAIVTVSHSFDLVLGWVLPSPITVTRSAEMMVP